MNRAIILHGMPSKNEYYDSNRANSQSNSHWIPWLQQQLCQHDILTQTPEMPSPFAPDYIAWKKEFEKLCIDEDTILVGHSCGGGFIIRWLSESPENRVKKVILIAPWFDVEGEYPNMFNFSFRQDISLQAKKGIDVLYSTNDQKTVQLSIEKLHKLVNDINYHEFINYGHFTFGSMKTQEFPELLQICLN